jgi:hypothetical protein
LAVGLKRDPMARTRLPRSNGFTGWSMVWEEVGRRGLPEAVIGDGEGAGQLRWLFSAGSSRWRCRRWSGSLGTEGALGAWLAPASSMERAREEGRLSRRERGVGRVRRRAMGRLLKAREGGAGVYWAT